METVSITLPSSKKIVSVRLDRKSMKTCRLKVYPSQEIVLSMPKTVPILWAEEFLVDKGTWIESKLDAFRKTVGYAATDEIRDGFSIKFLGEDVLFVVTECEKEKVYSEGKIIHICCRDANDQSKIQRQFENWWRKQAKELLQERTKHWYPIIEKYSIPMPKVSVRKMKTLWGSCSVNRGIITLNFYLIKAGIPYIDYVVLHELTHFLYPNHSKQFYMFLSNYMPDWKERKQVLDQDVVHGL